MTVLGKTEQQVTEDINEFVEQFEAAKRNHQNTTDHAADCGTQLRDSEQDARKAAAKCLRVFAAIHNAVRNAFDVANSRGYPESRIIAEAEEALRRIVQTQPMEYSDSGSKKSLDTAEASGLIIRCRKYWKLNTDSSTDLGTKSSAKPYGEFLQFVSEQFELEPTALFDRELEIREREQTLKALVKSQQSAPPEIAESTAIDS